MPFIPPMLATRLEDPRPLADPKYVAEPKLDGQRAQLHVREHRTVHAYSRPGRELIRLPGLAWSREIRWPVAAAALDGEAVAGDGSEGIQAVSRRARDRGARWPSPHSMSSRWAGTASWRSCGQPGASASRIRSKFRRPAFASCR